MHSDERCHPSLSQEVIKNNQKHGYTTALLRIDRRDEQLGIGLNAQNRVTRVGPAAEDGLRLWDWIVAFDGVELKGCRVEDLISTMPHLPTHEVVVLRPQSLALTSEALAHSYADARRMALSPQLSARLLGAQKDEERLLRQRSLERGELSHLPQLEELEATEAAYVQDLDHLISRFLTPLRCCRLLPKADEEAVFSNVEMLLAVNRRLLEALRTPAGNSTAVAAAAAAAAAVPAGAAAVAAAVAAAAVAAAAAAAAAFSTMAPFFRAYSVYCANFVTAGDHLDRLRQERPQLDLLVRGAEAAGGETIGSLLIRPVQRLCKYPLLFRELRVAVAAAGYPAHVLAALLHAEADMSAAAAEVKHYLWLLFSLSLILMKTGPR